MNPRFVKVDDKKYKINTSYTVAIECEEIAKNTDIGQYERALSVIYKLFGDEGLDNAEIHTKLLELGTKYLTCGKEQKSTSKKVEPDMDYAQDMDYVIASFRSDYSGLDLENEDMHWWTFNKLMNGLTENCVLNRVRYIRNYDINDVKDSKEREKWMEQKAAVALTKDNIELNDKQMESVNKFYKLSKIKREE